MVYETFAAIIPYVIYSIIAPFILTAVALISGNGKGTPMLEPFGWVLAVLVLLFAIGAFAFLTVAGFSIFARRCHDFNWSGLGYFFLYILPLGLLYFLLSLIYGAIFHIQDSKSEPVIVILSLLYFAAIAGPLYFRKGTPGPNRFGDEAPLLPIA